ncbi:kinase-like domain-containing protein [Glomus cerebriforme]|uniref:Kinase-like domain-containing protein n=1 Tax=Glomus cerebriforme TaxID=658196 RepID=A0A397TD25_9GLOM|nr:kinase-like domain-containing protein [Glomus cerebriforme]
MISLKEWIDMKVEDGGSGIVNKANWIDGGIKVALKVLLNNSIDDNQKEKCLRELKLLRQVNHHPNINRFLGVTKGNLRKYLEINFPSLHWENKIQMASDITHGLKYLHSKQIIHRDLHAKNILVNNGNLMITDLGLSKHSAEIKSDSRLLGMPGYIEPQCYINHNYKQNEKSDIYSLGILFWEISTGKPPFSEISILGIIEGIREKPTENTPFEYQQLYENCWKNEPNQRPDIEEACRVLMQLKSQFNKNNHIKEIIHNFGDFKHQ